MIEINEKRMLEIFRHKERVLINAIEYFKIPTNEINTRLEIIITSEGEQCLIDQILVISFYSFEVLPDGEFSVKYLEHYK